MEKLAVENVKRNEVGDEAIYAFNFSATADVCICIGMYV